MKLDAETLRKLALSGARTRLKELDTEAERLREVIRQLTGATITPTAKTKTPKEKNEKPVKYRKRRKFTERFKAQIVKEARESNNASAVGKKHDISPSLVRLWDDKAK